MTYDRRLKVVARHEDKWPNERLAHPSDGFGETSTRSAIPGDEDVCRRAAAVINIIERWPRV